MTSTPLGRLLGGGPAGIFLMSDEVTPARIAALSRLRGLHDFDVDCSGARSKRRLMATLASALALPEYFGANWDALADCLTDLEWMPAKGYVLALHGLEGLARRSPRDYAMLLDVLADAVTFWREQDVPFYVLLAGEASVLGSDLPVISA
jgi:RNAse (barnase) inhibitor barstar